MKFPSPTQTRSQPNPRQGKAEAPQKNWKQFFRKTIVLVLVISLAIHILFLLAFGSVAIFKGSIPKLPFVSQEIAADTVPEAPAPPMEESPATEEVATSDPFAKEAPAESAPEESAAALDMLTTVSGANWAPAIPKNIPVSEAGVVGGTGKGSGTGTGTTKGMGGPVSGKQLFGVSIQARKLGVIVDVSKSMQRYTPGLFREIFEKFPDADVVLTNGGGMMDWDKALKEFNDEVAANKKKAKETGKDYRGPSKMDKPKLARFNTGEAEDWVPVRGAAQDRQGYPGLKESYPDLYEQMRKRSNTWFVTSYAGANAVYLAFEELLRRKAEAVYWFSDFGDPIEGKEAENITQVIRDSKVEVILHSPRGKGKAADWATQVEAKFVKAKF
ncbi:MAG: hypothetical protein EBZ53_01085 [Verrucomicrobia bacterium]|nr:hypothetical protein [Verrucomicrobiota bacterium]